LAVEERVRGPRVTRAAVGHSERVWLKVYSKWFSFNERASGPSHVVEGGGVEFKPFFSELQVMKLPTESRKEELKQRMKAIKQRSSQDSRLQFLYFRVQSLRSGFRRARIIDEFWKSYFRPQFESLTFGFSADSDDLSRALKNFSLNDFLEAQDELYTLEHPMRPPPIRSWDHLRSRRSSAATVGPGSLSPPSG
jgi:hypothetical protein